jgi:O-acetyl-ADP-ribose deacetylase (regulator of RNase III)
MNVAKGDLLAARGILVHGCNALGLMGAGVALAIRTTWPAAYQAYRQRFLAEGLMLGDVQFVRLADDLVVANAITQQSVARKPGDVMVDYDAVYACFRTVAVKARELQLPVHFPRIGAGLAGGDWNRIANIIDKALGDIPGTLWVPD